MTTVSTLPEARPRGRQRSWQGWGTVLLPIGAAVVLLGLWELAVRLFGVPDYVLPPPSAVIAAGFRTREVLAGHIITTVMEASLGLLFGSLAGLLIAVVIISSRPIRSALYPLVTATQTVPIVVLAPLLIVWAGYGTAPKVILVMLTVFFPVLVATVAAADAAERDLVQMIRGLGGRRWNVLREVRLPSAIPAAIGGVRIAATYAIGAAVVAEYMAGDSGLGVYIQRSRKAFAVDQILAAVAVISILTAVLFLVIDRCARWATPWEHTTELEKS